MNNLYVWTAIAMNPCLNEHLGARHKQISNLSVCGPSEKAATNISTETPSIIL